MTDRERLRETWVAVKRTDSPREISDLILLILSDLAAAEERVREFAEWIVRTAPARVHDWACLRCTEFIAKDAPTVEGLICVVHQAEDALAATEDRPVSKHRCRKCGDDEYDCRCDIPDFGFTAP